MRLVSGWLGVVLVVGLPTVASAQDAKQTRAAALKFVLDLAEKDGGFRGAPVAKSPSARGTSAALRAIKYLGGEVPEPQKHAKFLLACYDPSTGGFADTPGGKPTVFSTAVGVMGCVELGIEKEKFRKAMDFLAKSPVTFEDKRIAAAAVEAWGVKDCPFDLDPWRVAGKDESSGVARQSASGIATVLRLGGKLDAKTLDPLIENIRKSQRKDGGWGHGPPQEGDSDAETTYRVMRALMLAKSKPADPEGVRKFLLSCRNQDGGFGSKPGEASNVGGVYYFAIISKWLHEMAK